MSKLLKRKDNERINALISGFEERTHSELVIVVNNKSDPYPAASLRFGVACSLSLTFIATVFIEFEYSFMVPLLTLISFFIFSLIGRLHVFLRMSLTEEEKDREVSEKALETFYLQGVNRTDHRATSMIYFSLLEKKVMIMVDKAINRKLEREDLKKVVEIVHDEFQQKNYYEGLETAIETLERLILYYFPSKVLEEKPAEMANQITYL